VRNRLNWYSRLAAGVPHSLHNQQCDIHLPRHRPNLLHRSTFYRVQLQTTRVYTVIFGSVRLTYCGFRALVKIASRIVKPAWANNDLCAGDNEASSCRLCTTKLNYKLDTQKWLDAKTSRIAEALTERRHLK